MENILIYSIITLAVAAGLAFIPASIARNKGYSFGLWWFYGWMLFIVAIIHVSLIPDRNAPTAGPTVPQISSADELKGYKELLDMGAITQEEFDKKKRELLEQ